MLSFYKFKLSNTNLRTQTFFKYCFSLKGMSFVLSAIHFHFYEKMIVRITQRCRFNFFFLSWSRFDRRVLFINIFVIVRYSTSNLSQLCRSFMLFDYNIFWSERDNTIIKRISKDFKLTWTLLMHTCCAKPFVFNKKHANKISWQLLVLSNFHQIGINTL